MACMLGPFDKRRLRTRCVACRNLHSKCEGGHPCRGCVSSGRLCKFDAVTRQPIYLRSSAHHTSKCELHPSRIITYQNEDCIWHFFTSFLPRNDFTARSSNEQQILKLYIHRSASLRNAIVAIGALDLSLCVKMHYSMAAATYYKQAVSSLRVQLTLNEYIDDATLWTALLLAIFELMLDSNGTGFMLHFTRGLPALLRQRNFTHGETKCHQTLLHTIQMLEAMRCAPFWRNKQTTLLEDDSWQRTTQYPAGGIPENEGFVTLYSLIRRFLRWNNIVFSIVLATTPMNMTFEERQQLEFLAEEGQLLFSQLELWNVEQANLTEIETPLSLLSSIYYYTVIIDIAANLNLPHFAYCNLSIPGSFAANLNVQLDELCRLLRYALGTTNLAGILLLWPLRVTGWKTIKKEQSSQVLEMLREIKRRGFAVAQSIEDVLMERWRQRSLL